MAKVLPVLFLNEKSFQIDADAFKSVLAKVGDRYFALISINGTTRTGKSYILSHFVRYFESKKIDPECTNWYDNTKCANFVWRSGRERETVGINLWSEPYFVKTHTGEEIAVLLIDTQGLFDEQTSARQNAIIFSISTLCSSVMIFNIMRMVDENILQQVEFFSGYAHMAPVYQEEVQNEAEAENINVKSESSCAHGTQLQFLIRDFELIEYDFGHHTKSSKPERNKGNFFKDTFFLQSNSDVPEENKVVRENILRNFQDVSVYCLPDPGKEFKRQEGNDVGPDEEFKKNAIAFVEDMVKAENLVKKTILEVPITGLDFQKYIDNWSKMCEKAEELFPGVLTVAENTAFTQYSIAMNLGVSKYKNDMDRYVKDKLGSATPEELEAMHSKLQSDAIQLFTHARKVRLQKFEEKFTNDLERNLEHCYKLAIRDNAMFKQVVANAEKNEKLLKEELQKMNNLMATERVKVQGMVRRFKDANETLRASNIQLRKEIEEQAFQYERAMEENQKAMEKLEETNLELNKTANLMQEQNKHALKENAEAIQQLREYNLELNKKANELQNETLKTAEENQAAIEELAKENKELSDNLEATAATSSRPVFNIMVPVILPGALSLPLPGTGSVPGFGRALHAPVRGVPLPIHGAPPLDQCIIF